MSNRTDVCPHCGRAVESAQEFCPDCGAWLYGGSAWPAPPPPIPASPARETGFDDDAEPVPLILPETPPFPVAAVAMRFGLLLLTLALGGVWIWAERMIVTGDDWAYWNHTWVAAAVLTLMLAGWWLWDAVRRGRRDGWERAWRLWEPPGAARAGTITDRVGS